MADISPNESGPRQQDRLLRIVALLILLTIISHGWENRPKSPPPHQKGTTEEQREAYDLFMQLTGGLPDSEWGNIHDWNGYTVFDAWYTKLDGTQHRYCTVFMNPDNVQDIKAVCDEIREGYLDVDGTQTLGASTSHLEITRLADGSEGWTQVFQKDRITLTIVPSTTRSLVSAEAALARLRVGLLGYREREQNEE